MMEPLVVHDPDDVTLEAFQDVALSGRAIDLDPALLERIDRTRRRMVTRLKTAGGVYGVTTGMGYLAGVSLSESDRASHQRNLLLGRAVGGAPYLEPAEARAVLLARLVGFLRGHAGVTATLCQLLVDRLNDRFVPAIPRSGIGCAGEIIPLSHAFQTFIGVGSVVAIDGTLVDAATALAERRVAPYQLGEKEGIALLAGAPGALGLAIVRLRNANVLARQLLTAAALAVDAIGAPLSPYGERVAVLANDPDMAQVLRQLGALLVGAQPREGIVQAPVSFRVIPQVMAHLWRTIGRLDEDLRRGLRASDDSPAFIDDEFVTTGNFHAVGLAAGMDAQAIALVQAAELAGQHIHRMLDHRFSGLPDQLTGRPGPQAGLVVVHKRVVGAINELRRLAVPASVGLADTSLGQEDAMSFAFEVADKLRHVQELVREVVACELLTAYQAYALGSQKVGTGLSAHINTLAETIKPVEEDRPLGGDISRLTALLDRGGFRDLS